MLIAIAAVDDNIQAQISLEGGRAPYYLIFKDGELDEVWSNPMRSGGGGAGIGVASIMVEKGINKLVAGKIGANMAEVLAEGGVEYEEKADMTVEEYINS